MVYDSDACDFVVAAATHSVDDPDDAGRAQSNARLSGARREQLVVRFRFARLQANGSLGIQGDPGVSASGDYIEMAVTVPAGVKRTWQVTSEESTTNGATDINSGRFVATTQEYRQAGVIFEGLVGALPGGEFRMNATLQVSSFEDSSADKAEVDVPLDVDNSRGVWHQVFRYRSGDGAVTAGFRKMGLALSAAGDNVGVYVRVD